MRTSSSALLLVCLPLLLPAASARADAVDDAVAGLQSPEAETVRASIDALGSSGASRAVRPLGDRIAQGLPPPLLDAAITAVTRLGGRDAHRVLYELCRHREPGVRVRALRGLITTSAPQIGPLLVGLLDDPAAAVRAAAVAAIDELGPREAWEELLTAARRGQAEAAAVLGRRADRTTVRRLTGRLQPGDEQTLAEAFTGWIRRDDLPAATRTAVIDRAATLGPSAIAALRAMATAMPEGDPVRAHAEQAVATAESQEGAS